MLRRGINRLNILINKKSYPIPYAGAKILAVFEQHELPIKFDCRKGQCKSCAVRVRFEEESMETLACMEEAIDGMEIETEGLQPTEVQLKVAPMETKRVTTRKIASKPQSEVQKANSKVFRILSQAQEAALDGEWEGCADYATELVEIAKIFENDVEAVFLKGPCRDLVRDFLAVLLTSAQPNCLELGKQLKSLLNPL
jgi:ferredoxin